MQLVKRTPSEYVKVGLLLLVVWALMSWLAYSILLADDSNLFDFFPRWLGSRLMLFGEDPYSVEATVTPKIYEGPIPFETPYLLYPAPITYILLPFWLIPWNVAISIWCGLTLFLLLVLPSVVFLGLDWKIRPWLLILITFLSLFVFRHSMNTFVLAQFTVFILACLIFAWWLAKENHPVLAALVLLGATIRPEGIVFTAGLLALFIAYRNYKLVAVWTGMMGILFLGTVLQIGFWIPDFLDGITRYQNEGRSDDPAALFPNQGIAILVMMAVVLWGLWMLWQVRSATGDKNILWSLAVLIVVVLLVLPQSKDYTLVYLLLPLWLVIWANQGRWTGLLPVILLLLSPWFYVAIKSHLPDGLPLEQFMTPLLTGVLLTYSWFQWKLPAQERTFQQITGGEIHNWR